jgi:ribose 5-phosphate isomerase B
MFVYLGADHRGVQYKAKLKAHLDAQNIDNVDLGTFSEQSVDYPVIAREIVEKVLEHEKIFGILICNSGIGVSIAANRYKGIRAALCFNEKMAEYSRLHNNANILCLGAEVTDVEVAKKMVDIFLHTEFEGGRHARRIDLVDC